MQERYVRRVTAPDEVVAPEEAWELAPALAETMGRSLAVAIVQEGRLRHRIWWPVV